MRKDIKSDISLPKLKYSGRDREYNFYSDELKARVIFEHLVNSKTHRWLDRNILGITTGKTNGRASANILYFLGMKADYRGLFKDYVLIDVIGFFKDKGDLYTDIVRLLKLLDVDVLEDTIKQDLDAELAEEGKGLEGNVKYYFGKRYERSFINRKLAVEKHGVNCHACGFNFEEVYGERGKGFIEIHHICPLSNLEEEMKINPETDLIPLCANCHRMVHRRKDDILDVESLKKILE